MRHLLFHLILRCLRGGVVKIPSLFGVIGSKFWVQGSGAQLPQGLRFGHQVQGLGFSFKYLLSNKQALPFCPFHLVFVPMPSGLGQVYRGFKPVAALTRRIYSQKNRFLVGVQIYRDLFLICKQLLAVDGGNLTTYLENSWDLVTTCNLSYNPTYTWGCLHKCR